MNPLILARIGIGVLSAGVVTFAGTLGWKSGETAPKEVRNAAIALGALGLAFLWFSRRK